MISACVSYHALLAYWSVRVCWWGLIAVWIVAGVYNAVRSPKVERRRVMTWRWVLPIVAWFIIATLPHRTWYSLTFCQGWVRDLGLVLLYVGTAFALWARFELGAMWTGAPSQRAGHELRTTGPYAITRHPIYTGLLTMLLGTTLVYHIGELGPFFLVIVLTLTIKYRVEEKLMQELFGPTYDAYRQRVPALIPWPRFGRPLDRR